MKKKSVLNRYLYMAVGMLLYLIIHEGFHLLQAYYLGIFEGIRFIGILGVEIQITEPLTIGGLTLASFSGLSSLATMIIGYLLYLYMPKILGLENRTIKSMLYFVTFIFMLVDPVYISLLSLGFGGDINGISQGLGISHMVIRIFYGVIFVINLVIIVKKVYPAYVNDFNKQ
ncbi:hypothetical protein J6TS1_30420 [Siminovitchia terrae]|uniref:Uncharacterized protein n=1 Tax=Siminovitchia terrae TaxID=1914933 RepID=A0ABQ4KYR2_SIMTE|nr:hypothetical protein [Siminovitchia terrae]GIN97172.1 hypothetical protein J6TS1_30420 [Siminovitchia terrae]